MVRRSYRPEQIINKLREAEVLLKGGIYLRRSDEEDRSDGRDLLALAQRIRWDED